MNTTILEQPDSKASDIHTSSQGNIEVQEFRNKHGVWLLEAIIYVGAIGFCIFLTGTGIYALVAESIRPMNLLVTFIGFLGTKKLLESALKRFAWYQDHEPKLTLSNEAICDHRTGVNIEFIDAVSIFFDQTFVKGREARANLLLTMTDGAEHIFDLKGLDSPSEQIARTVKAASGLEEAENIKSTNPRQDFILGIIGATMVGLLILKVVLDLCGVNV